MVNPQGPSSFIPKTPSNKSTAKPRGVRKIYVFTYLSLVLFFGTLIASASTFFFNLTVVAQLDEQKQNLANQRNAFDNRFLDDLKTLDQQIENAKRLLSTHVSVASIFDSLEDSTVETVQLTGVNYERTNFGTISMRVNATTEDLNSARFQRDVYASDSLLKKVSVDSPKLTAREEQLPEENNAREEVIFTLNADLSVADIPYVSEDEPLETEVFVDTFASSSDNEFGTSTDAMDEDMLEEEVNELSN